MQLYTLLGDAGYIYTDLLADTEVLIDLFLIPTDLREGYLDPLRKHFIASKDVKFKV